MSEDLLGVIVGGSIALIVSVVGYFVQNYFSIRALKIQSEISKTQRYEERRIQYRSKYLEPLHNISVNCCNIALNLMEKITNITSVNSESKEEKVKFVANISDMNKFEEDAQILYKISKNLHKETRRLLPFVAEGSDYRLMTIIFKVLDYGVDIEKQLYNILITYGNNKEHESMVKVDFTSLMNDYSKFIAHLHNINYIVEELLSGNEVFEPD